MKVVFWGRLAKDSIEPRLKQVSGVDLIVVDHLHDLIEKLPGADALITPDCHAADEAERIVQALRGPAKSVRWLQFVTAGQEGLTAAGLFELGSRITVTHQGGAVAPAVAEHAIAMLLGLARRFPEICDKSARHVWDSTINQRATALEGRVLAIIGFGNVGHQIALRARAFEMPILAVTGSPKPDALADEVHPLSGLHHVLRRADAIVVSIALTNDTYHLFGPEEFDVCKSSVFFVNVSRGGVVDQMALCKALMERKLAGAGLDVTEHEPLPADDPLWNCPNIIISPHMAGGGSPRSRWRLTELIAQNLERFIAGKPLRNIQERRRPS